MATVPVYGGAKVRATTLPGARGAANAGAESFGGTQATQLGRLGGAVQNLGHNIIDWTNRPEVKEAKQREKRARSMDRVNAAMAEMRGLNQDYYTREGEAALSVLDEGTKAYQDIRRKHMGDLDEEEQAIFTRAIDGHMNSQLGRLSNFQIGATGAHEKNVRTAWNAEAIEDGIVNWVDKENHVKNLAGIAVNTQQNNAGQAPEVRERLSKEAQYNYTEKIVNAVRINHGPDQALRLMEDFAKSNKIDPRVVGQLRTELEGQKKTKEVRDKVHNLALEGLHNGQPVEETLVWIRDLADEHGAQVADAVESKFLRWTKQKEAVAIRNYRTTNAQLNEAFTKEGAGLTEEGVAIALDRTNLSLAQKQEVAAPWLKAIASKNDAVLKTQMDQASNVMYTQLARIATDGGAIRENGQVIPFVDYNLEKLYPVLGKTRYDRLLNKQLALQNQANVSRKSDQDDRDELVESRVDDVVKSYERMYPVKNLKTPEAVAEWSANRSKLEDTLRDEIRRMKDPTPEKVQKLADSHYMSKVIDDGIFSDTTAPAFLAKTTDNYTADAREQMQTNYGVPTSATQTGKSFVSSIDKDEAAVNQVLTDNGFPGGNVKGVTDKGFKQMKVVSLNQSVYGVVEQATLQDGRSFTLAELRKGVPYVEFKAETDEEKVSRALTSYYESREISEDSTDFQKWWQEWVNVLFDLGPNPL